jgi:phage protein D
MTRLPSQVFGQFGDDIAPSFDLDIEGKSTGKGSQLFHAVRPLISGVRLEEDEELATLMELDIINRADTSPGQAVNWQAVIDSKIFAEGNTLDLYMGYAGISVFMARAEIVKWLPVFGSDGPVGLKVKAYDGRHRMTVGNQFKVKGKKKGRKTSYTNLSDDQIVAKIADKYGYGVDTDAPVQKKHTVKEAGKSRQVYPTRVQPSDMTDWQFLRRLASINNFDLWVDWSMLKKKNVVNFKARPTTGSPLYQFTYNGQDGSLIEAEPSFMVSDQATDIEVFHYDRQLQRFISSIISDPTPAETVKLSSASPAALQAHRGVSVGARVRFSAFGQTFEAVRDRPFRSKSEAETFVHHWLRERERDLLLLSGRVIGLNSIHPRQIHRIAGLGKRIDGLYRFTKVVHDQSPGKIYECEFVGYKLPDQAVPRRARTSTA